MNAEKRLTPAKNEELGFSDIWKFFIRSRITLLLFVVLGGLAGLLLYLKAPKVYTASTIVEMNKDATSGIGMQDLSGAASMMAEGTGFMTDMLTQQTVLMGDSTALSVIQRLDLMSIDPYKSLRVGKDGKVATSAVPSLLEQDSRVRDGALKIFKRGLAVEPIKNTRLLKVSYQDRDPLLAARIANAVVEAYLTNHTKTRYDATAKASTWLADQLDQLKQHTEDIHLQIGELEKKTGVIVMPSGSTGRGEDSSGDSSGASTSSPELQRITAMNLQLSQAETARIEKEAIYRMAQSNDPEVILGMSSTRLGQESGSIVSANSQSMQMLQTLRGQESGLKTRLAAAQVKYGSKNPIILEIQNQINAVHVQIGAELGRVLAQTKADYLLAKSSEDALHKSVDSQQQQLMSIGNDMASLAFLREEEESSRKLYQDLYSRLEEASIAAGVRSSGIAIDDPARAPSVKSSPVLRKYISAGVVVGLMLGILVGGFLVARDTKLNIPEDFEQNSQVPLLGVVPGFDQGNRSAYGKKESEPQNDEESAWIIKNPKSKIAESYRQIRTAILLSSIDSPPRVFLFTSPAGGDGKTSTSYNLAAAFAAQSSTVALIEADMRRPNIAKKARIDAPLGLSDVLSGRSQLLDVMHQHPSIPTFSIMSAGTIPPDPAELLGSKKFSKLLADLKSKYDYVLVDAPPVLPVTDPVVAGAAADVVIFVVRAGKTTRPELKRAWAALEKPSLNVLGMIVNDFHTGLQSYGYGYEGGSEYGNYYNDKDGEKA